MLKSLNDFIPANKLLLKIYYQKYLTSKLDEDLNQVNYYLNILNSHLSIKEKEEITAELSKIKNHNIDIEL